MPESAHPRPRLVALLVAAGVVLAMVGGVGDVLAAVGGTLAQPLFALAVAQWRGRVRGDARELRRDLLALTLLWVLGVGCVAAVFTWPLATLLQGGSLLAAFGLSAVVGFALVGLWRLWPLWHGLERDGG